MPLAARRPKFVGPVYGFANVVIITAFCARVYDWNCCGGRCGLVGLHRHAASRFNRSAASGCSLLCLRNFFCKRTRCELFAEVRRCSIFCLTVLCISLSYQLKLSCWAVSVFVYVVVRVRAQSENNLRISHFVRRRSVLLLSKCLCVCVLRDYK